MIAPHYKTRTALARQHPLQGLTLLEVVVSTMIAGFMVVASLNSLGAATRTSTSTGNRAIAAGLADDLMSEILPLPYTDPNGTTTFGPDGGESAGPRSVFDDVDDFNGWNQSPPKNRDGTTIPDRTNWRHRVDVVRVTPTDPTVATSGSTDAGAKRIRVAIEYRGVVLAEQFAIRTDAD
jgi:MSHA pilin protein MshD